MSDRIVFNGQEYDGVEAMPADVRRQYEDVMRLVRDGTGGETSKVVKVTTNIRTRIVVNGKEYKSADEMPAQVRAAYERAVAQAGGGTPSADERAALSQPTAAFSSTEGDASGSIANTLRRIGPWALIAVLLALWLLRRSLSGH